MVGRGAAGIWDVQPDNRPDYKYSYPAPISYPPYVRLYLIGLNPTILVLS